MDVGAQLVSVERHPGFQAQSVTAGETARCEILAASVHEELPQMLGGFGRNVQLVAVLPGVTGASDEHGETIQFSGEATVVLDVADLVGVEGGISLLEGRQHDRHSFGALHGDEGGLG